MAEKEGMARRNIPRPSCPYYPDSDSGLACPYHLAAVDRLGHGGTNWAGTASLILGILCTCLCWLSLFMFPAAVFIVASVLTVIFAGIGMHHARRSGSGRLASISGLVLGIVSLAMTVALFMMALVLWSD